jgi:hypothetical protein
MKRSQPKLSAILISGTAAALLFGSAGVFAAPPPKAQQTHKVYICHVPPGNPNNVRLISISERALKAHEGHGDDYLCYGNGQPVDGDAGEDEDSDDRNDRGGSENDGRNDDGAGGDEDEGNETEGEGTGGNETEGEGTESNETEGEGTGGNETEGEGTESNETEGEGTGADENGENLAQAEDIVIGPAAALEIIVCINRAGTSTGRVIRTKASGSTYSQKTGCEQ